MTDKWTANTALALNKIIAPTVARGIFFKVTTAGTTGSSEPSWPSTIGQTVYDEDVRYISFSSTFADLQSINPSAIIELFTLELSNTLHGENTIYRFHAGSNLDANGKIIWDGNEYLRFPIQVTGFAFQKGQLPRPKLVISNIGLTAGFSIASTQSSAVDHFVVSAILDGINQITPGNDLTGATVTRIRTLAKFIDAANFPQQQTVTGTTTATVVDPSDVENVTYTVTVVNVGGSNYFAINGSTNPVLTMKRGSTYTFDQSDSSNIGHPLRIESIAGGYQASDNEGVLGTDATVIYEPLYPDAPNDLRYYCTVHGNAMGNTITMNDPNTVTQTVDVVTSIRENPFGTPDPTAEFPREVYKIDRKATENRDVVEFELAAPTDLAGIRVPGRQATRTLFPSIGTFIQ